jgi:hypothetical protein
MNESDARAHFRAMGIPSPSQCLVDAWLRAIEVEQQMAEAEKTPTAKAENPAANTNGGPAVSQAEPIKAPPRGRSVLEPILRDQNALQESPRRSKAGRPRIVASWFPAVAKTMADGTALRMALLLNGLSLSNLEIRRLYRLVEFRRLYRLERRMYQLEKWGRIPQDELKRTRKRLLARIL